MKSPGRELIRCVRWVAIEAPVGVTKPLEHSVIRKIMRERRFYSRVTCIELNLVRRSRLTLGLIFEQLRIWGRSTIAYDEVSGKQPGGRGLFLAN